MVLVEGAVEWIIEDVVAVANGDWEAVTAILVLDAVRGVVGIRDFTIYVCDGDRYQFATTLLDFDRARQKELGD